MEINKSQEETKFENPDVDPGFVYGPDDDNDEQLDGLEDEREEDIDSDISIKELRGEDEEGHEEDALNYQNDRENGAYNPKNI